MKNPKLTRLRKGLWIDLRTVTGVTAFDARDDIITVGAHAAVSWEGKTASIPAKNNNHAREIANALAKKVNEACR